MGLVWSINFFFYEMRHEFWVLEWAAAVYRRVDQRRSQNICTFTAPDYTKLSFNCTLYDNQSSVFIVPQPITCMESIRH